MEDDATVPVHHADRARRPVWVAVHAAYWAVLVFGAGEVIRAVSFRVTAPELGSALALSVALTVALALFVGALGVVDGLFFRRGRLLWVWAGALLAKTVLSSAVALYRVVNADALQDQTHAQIAASIAPGLLAGAAFTLVVLGAAAALGVAVGSLVGRRRTRGTSVESVRGGT